ncbi:hypothetical protein BASA81_006347 [Batrachochytrium salamandrivorans]|nr:hypothetical protein BASA81_006347 [Batrachochytrium salamandrivorans]
MRALVAKNGKLELQKLAVPTPTPDQVLIKVHATALNRADTLQRRGVYPPPPGVTEVLGLELSGTVVGSNEERVMALVSGGAFAEYCVADKRSIMPVPKQMDLGVAAGIPEAWLTAFQLLHVVGRIQSSDVVMIHAGASGVGTAAIQLAKQVFGCQHIISTCSSSKHQLCLDLGASQCLDRHADKWDIGPRNVDLLLDCVGGGDYVEKNLAVLGMDSRWVLFGLMNSQPGQSDKIMRQVLGKRISLLGSTLRARTDEYKAKLVEEFTAKCLGKLESGELIPVLDKHQFTGLEQINQGLDYMETNQSMGKIIVRL